jgi:hypothetical protein
MRQGLNLDVRLLGLDPMGVAGRETLDINLDQPVRKERLER